MKATALLTMGALLCSCAVGFPDRRDADIVVDRDLRKPTEEAIVWWREATRGQVDFRIVDHCHRERSCITIKIAVLDPHMGGYAQDWYGLHGERGNNIKIDVLVVYGPENELLHVVTHELGHALGINHVHKDDIDLMRPKGYGPSCIMRPGTAEQWRAIYGNVNVMMVCDRLQIGGLAGYNINIPQPDKAGGLDQPR